jgi:prepilin-type N-terminal cleavage/methylation domain-containing protein
MKNSSYRARRGGFGMIETMIALMVVALGLASASPVITQASHAIRLGRDHYVATTIALATLEQARNLDVGLLPLLAVTGRGVNDQGVPTADGHFRRSVAVQPNVPSAGMTQVTVTVEIADRRHGGFLGTRQNTMMAYTSY